MKNYELMQTLSKLPAGAEVVVDGEMTEAKLRKGTVVKTSKDGVDTYAFRVKAVSATSDGDCVLIDSAAFVGGDD